MKRITLYALTLFGLCIGFNAQSSDQQDPIRAIAQEAQVMPRQVQMVLGGRTAFSEYRTSYNLIEARVRKAAFRLAAQERRERERVVYLAVALRTGP